MITQEQYSAVYLGLESQGWQRSFNDERTICLYRDPSIGRKCAIGHLIADEDYTPAMDAFDSSK